MFDIDKVLGAGVFAVLVFFCEHPEKGHVNIGRQPD